MNDSESSGDLLPPWVLGLLAALAGFVEWSAVPPWWRSMGIAAAFGFFAWLAHRGLVYVLLIAAGAAIVIANGHLASAISQWIGVSGILGETAVAVLLFAVLVHALAIGIYAPIWGPGVALFLAYPITDGLTVKLWATAAAIGLTLLLVRFRRPLMRLVYRPALAVIPLGVALYAVNVLFCAKSGRNPTDLRVVFVGCGKPWIVLGWAGLLFLTTLSVTVWQLIHDWKWLDRFRRRAREAQEVSGESEVFSDSMAGLVIDGPVVSPAPDAHQVHEPEGTDDSPLPALEPIHTNDVTRTVSWTESFGGKWLTSEAAVSGASLLIVFFQYLPTSPWPRALAAGLLFAAVSYTLARYLLELVLVAVVAILAVADIQIVTRLRSLAEQDLGLLELAGLGLVVLFLLFNALLIVPYLPLLLPLILLSGAFAFRQGPQAALVSFVVGAALTVGLIYYKRRTLPLIYSFISHLGPLVGALAITNILLCPRQGGSIGEVFQFVGACGTRPYLLLVWMGLLAITRTGAFAREMYVKSAAQVGDPGALAR